MKSKLSYTMKELIEKLNIWSNAYYNQNRSIVTDQEYDDVFDQLSELEKETGIIYANSPSIRVGYTPVSTLDKAELQTPLLSLDKTKQLHELSAFIDKRIILLMLKLDGLTVELDYENGKFVKAFTRGNGIIGEDITHNIPAFKNVPLTIPYKKKLRISGEALIFKNDFERIKVNLVDSSGNPYRNSRNLASGSVRCHNPEACSQREVNFLSFKVLEGLDENTDYKDSKNYRLYQLSELGFEICPYFMLDGSSLTQELLQKNIKTLQEYAIENHIPIDGIVATYDCISYSISCGRTEKFYKDGIAFKFNDKFHETILRKIEWTPTRSGELAPVAVFDTIAIDGCDVSRATLHNLTFIKNLELSPGCRILISKRNMIIPHIEDNLDRKTNGNFIPPTCPCCGKKTRIYSRPSSDGRIIETLHCDNPDCESQQLRKFVHFAEKKAMNIEGLSEATLEKFIERGYLQSFQDIYHLDKYHDQIVKMEGFGQKSYERLWDAITTSRNTTFVNYLVAMDIPMVGRTISRLLNTEFSGNLLAFETAALNNYDFTRLVGIGHIMCNNIQTWFADVENIKTWRNLQMEMNFEKTNLEASTAAENPFTGKSIVTTGKLENFTRDSINTKILELGGKPGSAVTKKTDFLIAGEKAGSKLTKAQALGVPVLSEQEFLSIIA